SVIVGWKVGPGFERAMHWNPGESEFDNPFNSAIMEAHAVSADGRTAGGNYSNGAGRAWIFVPGTGVMDLRDYLFAKGLDVSGWLFGNLTAISMDGMVLAGSATHNGGLCGFVANLHKDTDGD